MSLLGGTLPGVVLRFIVVGTIASSVFFKSTKAAESAESDRAYDEAVGLYQIEYWRRASDGFRDFIKNFPDSAKVPQAVLLQAHSLFNLKDYVAVTELLEAHESQAGELADQYQFLRAEAQFGQQFWARAGKIYEGILATFPKSRLRLEAGLGQASAAFRLSQLDRTIALLSETNGVFQLESRTSTNGAKIIKGNLLLADALFTKKRYTDAERVLQALEKRPLMPDDNWQSLYLMTSSAFADQRTEEALKRATNLVQYSKSSSGTPVMHSNALMLMAEIKREKNPDAAIEIYEDISKISGVSTNRTRQAVLKMIDVMLDQNRITQSIERLNRFLTELQENTNSPPFGASDQIRLTLGELYLRQFRQMMENPPENSTNSLTQTATNFLHFAKREFDIITNTLTNRAQVVGEAHLNRGWCFWEEGLLTGAASAFEQGQRAFAAAVESLPVSETQAIARFKWADCQFKLEDFKNAIKNYRFLIENYGHLPQVKSTLFDQALNQIVRASIEAGDFSSAKEALERTLAWFPTNTWSERSLLTYGQELLNRGRPGEAREALVDFENRFPSSDSIPEARLVRAETFAAERNWPDTLEAYDAWVSTFTNHLLLSRAEFDRALNHDRAGRGTNALSLFKAYVARFPTNSLAPLAQYWIATYHFNQRDYSAAERGYGLLRATNSPPSVLGCRAWLMAGRSALLGKLPSVARRYLTNLVNDGDCPESIRADAMFALGEVELMDVHETALTNQPGRFQKAIRWFSQVATNHASSRLVPDAYGKLGSCYFQESEFDKAKTAYEKVIQSPVASVSSRSQAEVGLGDVLVEQADQEETSESRNEFLDKALTHYLNVLFEGSLRRGELADPFWLKEAGLSAGKLAERLGNTRQAKNIYERLLRDLPGMIELRATLEQRLNALNSRDG